MTVARPRGVALAGVAVAIAACVDHRGPITGTQSIGVELVAPADPGDIDHRLTGGQPAVIVNLTAYDAASQVDTTFDRDVRLYVQFLGTLTPLFDATRQPVKAHLTAGRALGATVTLPAVYGPTTLWVDDASDINPTYADDDGGTTYATGTSPALWFRDPFVSDIQRPADEARIEALFASPLQTKQVSVRTSRYGARGRLVVTSVFAQGYTVADVQCSDDSGAPPCTAQAYDHILVFSFSAPRDQDGRLLQLGQAIDGFAGGVSEFNGLTEIGFPASFATTIDVNPARLPAPVALDNATWFRPIGDPDGIINFERNEAGAIAIDNAKVCALDDDYDRFKQWKLDPSGVGGDCSNKRNVLNVITAGVVAEIDPASLVGKTLKRVVGMVRPVQIGTFAVWIIFPRSAADLTLQ